MILQFATLGDAERREATRFLVVEVAPNLVHRAFYIPSVDRVWVGDFTELLCRNGKAYAVAIMDLCSRRILGITVSHNMQTRTLIHTLDQARGVRRS
jgi:putative transposase